MAGVRGLSLGLHPALRTPRQTYLTVNHPLLCFALTLHRAGNEWPQQGRQATLGLEAGVAEGQTRRSRPGAPIHRKRSARANDLAQKIISMVFILNFRHKNHIIGRND